MTTPPPQVWPTLRARDARSLIRFLVDVLGFEEVAVYGEGDVVHHAELAWPLGGGIMLGSVRDTPDDPWSLQPGTAGCYVVVGETETPPPPPPRRRWRGSRAAPRHRLRLAGLHRPRPGGQPVELRHLPRGAEGLSTAGMGQVVTSLVTKLAQARPRKTAM